MLNRRYRVLTAVLLAMCGFVLSWVLIHHGWFARKLMEDTTVYAHYAALMKHGLVPYLNFKFEYPPLALPLFLIPGWIAGLSWHVYEQSFEWIEKHGIFSEGRMGAGDYGQATISFAAG